MFISYEKFIRIQNDRAELTAYLSTSGMLLPCDFDTAKFTYPAFENFDHNKSSLSGLNRSHDTVRVLFQEVKFMHQNEKPYNIK